MNSEQGTRMTPREMVRAHSYPVLAAVSTVTLVITSISVIEASRSISQWAKMQNDCIERTFRINGKNTQGLSAKVWSCNGGGD